MVHKVLHELMKTPISKTTINNHKVYLSAKKTTMALIKQAGRAVQSKALTMRPIHCQSHFCKANLHVLGMQLFAL